MPDIKKTIIANYSIDEIKDLIRENLKKQKLTAIDFEFNYEQDIDDDNNIQTILSSISVLVDNIVDIDIKNNKLKNKE